MRLLRLGGLIVFVLSSAAFLLFRWYENYTTDTTGPVISFPTDTIYMEVGADEGILLSDVTAFDEKDKDVTDRLIIESISKFVSPGKRIISYAAFDNSNNITKKERYLVYTDYKPPRFSLSRPLSFNVGDYIDIIEYMKAEDCIDGDLSNNIRYEEMDEDFGEHEGEFDVKFWVTNSCGDSSYLPVKVFYQYPSYDRQSRTPLISMEDYIVYLEQGDSFKPEIYPYGFCLGDKEYSFLKQASYTIGDKSISRDTIKIYSNVNTKIPGVYYVDYELTIYEGFTGKTRLIVVVEETNQPVN